MPNIRSSSFWIAFFLGIAAVYVWGMVGARVMTAKSKGNAGN